MTKKKKGKGYRFAALLTLASCGVFAPSDPPRTSLPEERAAALAYVADAEILLEAAALAGLDAKAVDDGRAAILTIRDIIAESETVPVDWHTVMRTALRLSLAWVVKKPQ